MQVKKGGGMSINSTLTLTNMSEKLAQLILHEYSILTIDGAPKKWVWLRNKNYFCSEDVIDCV